ncbi:MAG: hypothetical protein FWD55_06780, partial [Propionibacteriaceae bacterium]|nr:hypothetical protein [Propionibacteriaceae bacterium]
MGVTATRNRRPWWGRLLIALWIIVACLGMILSVWVFVGWSLDPFHDNKDAAQGRRLLTVIEEGSSAPTQMQV